MKKLIRIVLLASLGIAGFGCAVLTVKVDVYKGSLVNHEDVQLDQMTILAASAKPLLIQLRDRLILNERNHDIKDLQALHDKWWYKTNYIDPKVKKGVFVY